MARLEKPLRGCALSGDLKLCLPFISAHQRRLWQENGVGEGLGKRPLQSAAAASSGWMEEPRHKTGLVFVCATAAAQDPAVTCRVDGRSAGHALSRLQQQQLWLTPPPPLLMLRGFADVQPGTQGKPSADRAKASVTNGSRRVRVLGRFPEIAPAHTPYAVGSQRHRVIRTHPNSFAAWDVSGTAQLALSSETNSPATS
ncbi:unnamed protein product [Lampetra planeri]